MSKQHKKQPSPSPLVQPAANPEPPAAGFAFFEHAWLPQITVAAAAVLVWSACISNGFVFFDDDKAILYNHALQNPSFGKFFSGQNLGMYAPVSWIAYWVGSLISGQEAWGYHLLGVLLHALNAMLVFSLGWASNAREFPEADLWKTFNMGLGMVAVIPEESVKRARSVCRDLVVIGHVEKGRTPFELRGV